MRLRTLAQWLASALMVLVAGAGALAQDAEPTANPGTNPDAEETAPADVEATEINTEDALGDLARRPAGEGELLFGSFIGVVRVLGAQSIGAQAASVEDDFDAAALTGIEADDPDA